MRHHFVSRPSPVAQLRAVPSRLASWIAPPIRIDEIFPSLEDELAPQRHLLRGNVLNAGAGERDIRWMVDGRLYNQDIIERQHLDFVAPLHAIPTADGFFDAIVCNAVLEHVANPDEVMDEFARVTAPGGSLLLTIPFMQPEHRDPTDFQRYTSDGIRLLCERHGFRVIDYQGLHSVFTTLAWIVREWLDEAEGLRGLAARAFVYRWVLRQIRRGSTRYVPSLASAHRVIAIREPA